MRFVLKLEAEGAADNETTAKQAARELEKWLDTPLVKSMLIGRGITLMGRPVVTVTKK